jgi:hypothetical protein
MGLRQVLEEGLGSLQLLLGEFLSPVSGQGSGREEERVLARGLQEVGKAFYALTPVHETEAVDGAERARAEFGTGKVLPSELASLGPILGLDVAEVEVPDKETCGVGFETRERSGELQGPLLVGFPPKTEVEHVGVKVAVDEVAPLR